MKQLSDYSVLVKKVDKMIANELNPTPSDCQKWNVKQVIRWVCSLENGRYVKYQKKLEESMTNDGFKGSDLGDIERSELKDYGMDVFGDRKDLIKAMRALVNGSDQLEGNNS